jgi:hypothetical protein
MFYSRAFALARSRSTAHQSFKRRANCRASRAIVAIAAEPLSCCSRLTPRGLAMVVEEPNVL